MAEKSAFKLENIITSTTEKQGLLEELHLPPRMISFLRQHARHLQIVAAALVVAILAWNFYGRHVEKRQDEAAALLAKAMEKPAAQRGPLLEEVVREYPGTGAAAWSALEQAHSAADAGNWAGAAHGYERVLDEIAETNPLAPLVRLSSAQAHENNKEYDRAMAAYRKLVGVSGFAVQGYLGMARLYEVRGDAGQAEETYRKILALKDVPSPVRERVEQKLARF